MERRRFIQLGAASIAVTALGTAPGRARAGDLSATGFAHGVASGDPLPDSVVLWTRFTPEPEATPGSGLGAPSELTWEVATDPGFAEVVRAGSVITDAGRDHTAKIDPGGLAPATDHWYRFTAADGTRSPVGRTRTAPELDADLDGLRFGYVSCSHYEVGYFAPYRALADRDDLDFVLHMGDYYYEGYSPNALRPHDPPHEITTLEDYRRRIACYRGDADLQALHARHPFVLTWDDHEVANNQWRDGADNHDPSEGPYAARKAAAHQAYFEWMPVRSVDPNDPSRLYRRLQFGRLADLTMLDLRQYRDEQVTTLIPPAGAVAVDRQIDSPDRTITGRPQMDWIKQGLTASDARWRLMGSSVMVTPIHFPPLPKDLQDAIGDHMPISREGIVGNADQWDGYAHDRRELLEHIAGEAPGSTAVDNVVFLVGDVHSTFACDVPLDAALYPDHSPSIATELVSTSVTSDNFDEITRSPPRTTTRLLEEMFKANNRHIRHYEFDSHGWSVVDVTPDRLQVDWYYVDDRADRDTTSRHAVSYRVRNGHNRVERVDQPVTP